MSDGKREDGDVRKELNQLWRTTLDQFDEIKNAIVRSSSAGKAKLDATFLRRQRERLLMELGTKVLEASEKGELRLPDRAQNTATRIRELEAQIEDQEGEVDRLLHPDAEEAEEEQARPAAAPEETVEAKDADDAPEGNRP